MSICLQGNTEHVRNNCFRANNKEVAAHLENIDNHEQKRGIAMCLCNMLHGGKQFWKALLNSDGIGYLYRSNGEDVPICPELLEVPGQQFLSRNLPQFRSGSSKDGLAVVFDIFSCQLCQYCCDLLVTLRTRGRAQD